jgi:hypothetical protein
MKLTELPENLTAASVLDPLVHAEVDPDSANQLYTYGCSHVDAHH